MEGRSRRNRNPHMTPPDGRPVAPIASIAVGLFGSDPDAVRPFGAALGKKGTESDLRFWNKKERDVAVTAVSAIAYPERVTPMLQVASMCDVAILLADRVDAAFGEQLLALAAVQKPGVLIVSPSEAADRARSLAKDHFRRFVTMELTSTEDDFRRFRELILGMRVERDLVQPTIVALDHAFTVRGVGTVALGFVRRGVVRIHDELRLLPDEQTVTVRSIQILDEDQKEAPAGSRVGIALRGVDADQIERGAILTADASIRSTTTIDLDPFEPIKFAKDPLAPGRKGIHLTIGMYTRPASVEAIGRSVRLSPDRTIPALAEERGFITVLRPPGSLRILGTGTVRGASG